MFCVYSETAAMAGKVVLVLLVAVCVWSLAVAEKDAVAKDAVADKVAVAGKDAELSSEIQSLREKTAEVFHRHFNYYYYDYYYYYRRLSLTSAGLWL